ncbi:hypothetical protein IIA79_02190 [bacterium]|nr:hypothetical protein [bacterium]
MQHLRHASPGAVDYNAQTCAAGPLAFYAKAGYAYCDGAPDVARCVKYEFCYVALIDWTNPSSNEASPEMSIA